MDSKYSCPYCGSSDSEYVGMKNDGSHRGFISECAACGCVWTEWYDMMRYGTTISRNGDIHSDSNESEDADER